MHWQRRRIAYLVLFLVACAVAVDAVFIEPYRIEVTHWNVPASLAAPLKIAHISDLHTYGFGRREQHMLALLETEQPDIIVITGDTIVEDGTYEKVRETLVRLHAPLGVWLVRGNWENWRPLRHERAFYDSAGVHFLVNAGALVRQDVWLGGLDDPWTGRADLKAALAGAPAGSFKIMAFHSPAYFDFAADYCNLALAGHTHGGQVRVPFLKPLWLPGGCGHYVEGWYQKNASRIYVSRGVGTSHLRVRFDCRPELAIITVGESSQLQSRSADHRIGD